MIGRTLSEQEKDLHQKLVNLYENHIQLAVAGNLPPEHIQYRYKNFVRMKLRKAVSKAYFTGIDTIDRHINKIIPDFDVFPSGTDATNMGGLIQSAEKYYWSNMNDLINRENTFQLIGGDKIEKKKPFDHDSSMLDVAIHTVYGSYNKAVASKYPNALGFSNSQNSRTAAALDSSDIALGGLLGLGFATLQRQIKLKWQTKEDVKVCDTGIAPFNCQDMNQKEFDPNDPELPEFPVHRYCRCRWETVEGPIDTAALLNMLALTGLTANEIRRRQRE